MSKIFKKFKSEHLTNDYDKNENLSNSIKNQSIHSIYKLTENKMTDFSFNKNEISAYSNIFSGKHINISSKNEISSIVPNLSNVDEIFQFLSQKIAKYCQILADLTNSEVFFKTQLLSNYDMIPYEKKSNGKSNSLYWGTTNMLFKYSHGKGLTFDDGDCLIRVNRNSFSNDINFLVEDIFNEPNLELKHVLKKNISNLEKPQNEDYDLRKISNQDPNLLVEEIDEIKIRECFIKLNQIDKNELEKNLNYFEKSNNKINPETNMHEYFYELDLVEDYELFSDKCQIKFEDGLEIYQKNFFKFDKNCSLDENNAENLCKKELKIVIMNNKSDYPMYEEFFCCGICKRIYFKHLTQLKIHELRVHKNVPIEQENNECPKCKFKFNDNYNLYVNHLIECFFPNLYQCKTCHIKFSNYSQFLFHTKYIHSNFLYMSLICNRKFKFLKELLDHIKLMHSKNKIYCEICMEDKSSKKCLYEHYKTEHIKKAKHHNNCEAQKIFNPSNIKILEKLEKFSSPDFKLVSSKSIEQKEFTNSQTNLVKENQNLNSKESDLHIFQKNDLIRGLIDRKHQCKWCMLRFYTKSQLKQHEVTHINSVLICPICDKEFTHKDRLSGHMKCHMEPSLECKVCGKKFKRLCNLYNHELVHGLTEHAFMLCQFCGRGFRSRRDYQNHVIANHRDQLIKSGSQDGDKN